MILASVLVRLTETHSDAHAGSHPAVDQSSDCTTAHAVLADDRERTGDRIDGRHSAKTCQRR